MEKPSTGAQVRTALVLLHVLAISLMALPAPAGGMSKSAWKEPTVQAEFVSWRGRLAAIGVELTPEEFEDNLWTFASGVMEVRSVVLAPFEPYYDYFGTWQSWRMFVAPHTYPANLHIDVRVDEEWKPVYVGRSAEHAWMRDFFDHDRVRSAVFRYSWKKYSSTYRAFTKWIARRAAVDFPEADKVRVRYFRTQTPSPEQTLADEEPEGSFILNRVLPLSEFR